MGATARRLPALADAIRDAEALSIEVCIKKRARGGGPPLALAAAADRRFAIVFDVAPHLPSQILLQTLGNFRLVKVCELRIKVGNASKAEAKRVGRACCSAADPNHQPAVGGGRSMANQLYSNETVAIVAALAISTAVSGLALLLWGAL